MMVRVFCLLIAGLFLNPLFAFEQVYAESRAVIKSASEPDYPPFSVVSSDGKADGFSVELLREALSAVNLDVAFNIGQWDIIKAELRDGDIQVLPLVGRTPEREAIYDFTFPYLTLHGAIFVKKGDTRINKISDLTDKTVVVMRGDNAEEFVRRTNISAHIVAVDTFKQAMELLDAGKYDAVIAQRLMGLQLLKVNKIKNVVPLDIVLNDFRQDLCFAVRSGDKALLSRLNEGLAIIIANGTFDRIHKKWFSPLLQKQITFKDVWKYVLYIIIPLLIAITLVSISLLRREVKRKTNSLIQEIDKRKLMEQYLKETKDRYDLATSVGEIGVWDWNIVTGKLIWNDEVYKILGLAAEGLEPSFEMFMSLVHPDDRKPFSDSVTDALQGKRPFNCEYRVLPSNGKVRVCHAIGNVTLDESGKAVRMMGTFQDITERTRAENALRESEEKFRNLFNNSEIAMFRTKLDGSEVLDANEKWLDLVGKTREEAIGKPSQILWVDPNVREEMVKTLIAEGSVSQLEFQLLNPKNGVRDCITSLVLYREQGILEGSILDITDRKRAEEELREEERKYRLLFEFANDGIFIQDETGFIDCNQRGADMYSLSREAIIGHSPREFAPKLQPDGRLSSEVAAEKIQAALSGTPQVFEWQPLRADGSTFDVEITLSRMELGGKTCLQAIVRDISERKLFEHERLKTQKLESVGTLAGGIAHDFNNLLQGVFGYISMAKITHDNKEESLAMLDQAEEAIHMSVNLTTQLLTFSKGGKPVKKLIRLRPTIESAVKFALSGSHTGYRLNVTPDLWSIEADAGQLAQVIQNIVLNANEAMAGRGTVTISVSNMDIPAKANPRLPGGGHFVRIDIEDTGTGISEQNMTKIFDPYFTTKQKGSGLGLATSYSIIKNHGGQIEVKSEPGKGTTFTIYLPASRAAEAEVSKTTPSAVSAKKGRILLMDDEDIVSNVAKKMIAALGHEVEGAEDGKRAIELFQKARDKGRPFDLVILDLTVKGGMGGEEAIAKIRAIDPKVKAVVSSGYADSPVVANYLTYGFSAVLNKPYKIDSLKDCLGQFFS
jgi:two-component system, cell cycle sensor histidine kinase and response regulator CckA